MYASFDYIKRIVPATQTGFITPTLAFPLDGANIDLWFDHSLYYGVDAVTDVLSISRASVGYAKTSSGGLTQFASGELRITNLGLLVEDARTNVVLWNRDLTNGVWVPTNITPLKDQTGPDGVANSASSLEATAGNGTILQSITLASSARFQSTYVKRIIGTGTVNMTMDNGATWTAITVTSDWTQVSIPTQTIANPVVGFQIVTSGDKIAVDFVQNENGTWGSSPIPTTTTSAARAADVISITGSLATILTSLPQTAYADVILAYTASNNYFGIVGAAPDSDVLLNRLGDGGSYSKVYMRTTVGDGSLFLGSADFGGSLTFFTGVKMSECQSISGRSLVGGGGTVATDANHSVAGPYYLGGYNYFDSPTYGNIDGYIRRVAAWSSRLSDSTIQSLTAP